MKLSFRALSLCACGTVVFCFTLPAIYGLRPIERVERLERSWHIPAPAFTLNEIIRAASRKHQVKQAFIKSIIAAESGFSPEVVSPKGAIGLMQLMPATAKEYGADPTLPAQNVDAGTHYLSWLMQRYSHRRDQLKRTIAAYNAGPGSVDRFHGVPPFRETRAYVARVLRYMKKYDQMSD